MGYCTDSVQVPVQGPVQSLFEVAPFTGIRTSEEVAYDGRARGKLERSGSAGSTKGIGKKTFEEVAQDLRGNA